MNANYVQCSSNVRYGYAFVSYEGPEWDQFVDNFPSTFLVESPPNRSYRITVQLY